jgi:hypothetical protein
LYLKTWFIRGIFVMIRVEKFHKWCLLNASQADAATPREVCASRSLRAIEQLPLRVDLARSPSRIGITAICAFRPSKPRLRAATGASARLSFDPRFPLAWE